MDDQARPQAMPFFIPDLCSRRAVGVLVLVAELLAIVLVLAREGFSRDGWVDLGLSSLYVQCVALTTAAALCAMRDRLARLGRPVAALLAFLVIVVDALLTGWAAQALYVWALQPAAPEQVVRWSQIVANATVAAIIGGLVLRYFYVQEQLRLQQQAELQARIQALQSRIRPHFLFNSMNIIASLIAVDPDTAEQVVEDLSDLFRASLRDSAEQVSLSHELELCRRYVRIEQLRLGPRLQVDWDIDDVPLDDIRIPLLTLQPLLENAIYHGIQPLAEGGIVRVALRYQEGEVLIHVQNPVPGESSRSPHEGNRMAIENIRHRLAALYGADAGLECGRTGASYGTTLHYPFNIGGPRPLVGRETQEQ